MKEYFLTEEQINFSGLLVSVTWANAFLLLAHGIRVSEILPLDKKLYLTHAVLLRLSREDYIHWLYWNSRTWSSSDVIVM